MVVVVSASEQELPEAMAYTTSLRRQPNGGPWLLSLCLAGALSLSLVPSLISAVEARPSVLLDTIKDDPGTAEVLCADFNALNEKGMRVHERESLGITARRHQLSQLDAEILTTYVVGLYCPNVR